MAAQSRSIRRGLPRVEGGDPWPPAGQAPARTVTAGTAAQPVPASTVEPATPAEAAAADPTVPGAAAVAEETAPGATAVSAPVPAVISGAAPPRQLRRGLPRVPGGQGSPPAGQAPISVAALSEALSGAPAALPTPTPAAAETPTTAPVARAVAQDVPAAVSPAAPPATAPAALTAGATPLRRGLPRVPGGVFGSCLHRRGGSGRRSDSGWRPRFTARNAGKPAAQRRSSRCQRGGCGGRRSGRQ